MGKKTTIEPVVEITGEERAALLGVRVGPVRPADSLEARVERLEAVMRHQIGVVSPADSWGDELETRVTWLEQLFRTALGMHVLSPEAAKAVAARQDELEALFAGEVAS